MRYYGERRRGRVVTIEEEGRLTREEIRKLSSSWLVLSWDGRVEVVVANWV